MGYNFDLNLRIKEFVLKVLKVVDDIAPAPFSPNAIICHQLVRSASSIGSNYRAVVRARSDREFFAKMCIVLEEADESF